MTARPLPLYLLLASVTLAAPAAAPTGIRSGMDFSVKPGDNFFAFANGGWMKATEIPADRAGWGVGWVVEEEAEKRSRGILEAAASAPLGSEARKAGDYYATFLDQAAIDAQGLAPLQSEFARIATVKDRKALATVFGEQLRADVDPMNSTNFYTDHLFGLWVALDLNVPTRHAPYLLQGGLGLPDRAYYLDASPHMAELRTKYQAYIATMLSTAGISDAQAKAARIFALETKMAQAHVSREVSEDALKANNPWKRTEFASRAPGLDWASYFKAAGLDGQAVVFVWQPSAVTALSALVQSEPLTTWREYLTFHAIDRNASVLPKAFGQAHFAFFGHALRGVPEESPRWRRALFATDGALGDAIGQIYVKQYFPPAAKAQVQEMVKNIMAAFSERIDHLAWMAPQTKLKAKEKLATLYVGVGYPEHWIDYAGLTVVRGEALANAARSSLFEYHRRLAQLGQPVDLTEWWMTPQTVNAVNLPLQNALNFPAAILQPPYFDPTASAAVNYGGIGATIGHEISHSFDDQGSQFDAHGQMVNWWTPEDLAHFQASSAQLAAQFDGYKPFPDLSVNGKQTLSENIADLAGLAAAHDAWLLSLGGKPASLVEGFNGEQTFFLAYAQGWRSKVREKALRSQIVEDGHAPDEYRTDTVRNLDAWYTAFDVQPGQLLYLAPKERVRVW